MPRPLFLVACHPWRCDVRRAAALTALVIGLVWLAGPAAAAPAGADTPRRFSRVERAVAALHATDLAGHLWTRDAMRGRVILVDFWATWCAPCLAELPARRRLRDEYRSRGFEILGVSLDTGDRRSFVRWLNRQGIAWPQVYDGRGRAGPIPRQFGVAGIPASFLIDRQGRVVAANLRGRELRRAVADLMAPDE